MKLKRFSLTLLVLSLVLCSLFVSASAAAILDSGKCGANLTWKLESDGTLTISGTGRMYDYSWSTINPVPWLAYKNGIEAVKIQSGTTYIGDYAFYEYPFISSVSIPNSVTSIGSHAFSGCSSLRDISIPNSIKSIDTYAFSACTSLAGIKIPNSVTDIGSFAFKGCTNLTSITLPDSITTIPYGAFSACSSLASINIPDTVTSIDVHAFSECTSLTSINISDKVTNIGSSAFSRCTALASISIPDSVTSIGSSVFCNCNNLTNIRIPASVSNIDFWAFGQCRKLKSVIFEGKAPVISDNAFDGVSATCTYPCSGFGWANAIKSSYGGTITWKKSHSNPTGTTSVTAPTCTTKGYTTYTCDCGYSYKDNYVDALGHTYQNGKCTVCQAIDPDFSPLVIISQPKNTYTKYGETVRVTVVAEGEGLTYQWYVRNIDDTKYSKSSNQKSSYQAVMSEATKDRRAYCVITDAYGNQVKTNTVVLRMAASVTTQPESVVVAKGETAKVTLKAAGDSLKYEWYYRDAGTASFKKTPTFTGISYSAEMTAARHGRQIYCKITDKYGKSVKTNIATLSMKATITT